MCATECLARVFLQSQAGRLTYFAKPTGGRTHFSSGFAPGNCISTVTLALVHSVRSCPEKNAVFTPLLAPETKTLGRYATILLQHERNVMNGKGIFVSLGIFS